MRQASDLFDELLDLRAVQRLALDAVDLVLARHSGRRRGRTGFFRLGLLHLHLHPDALAPQFFGLLLQQQLVVLVLDQVGDEPGGRHH